METSYNLQIQLNEIFSRGKLRILCAKKYSYNCKFIITIINYNKFSVKISDSVFFDGLERSYKETMSVKCFYDISNLQKYDKNEYPEFFARFYDLIYSKEGTGIDESFYFNRVSQTRGKILEAGVRTGRFFIKAFKDGADIYGVDISPAMIEVLRKKLDGKDQGRVIVKDITDMNLNVRFDLIISPFRVFAHLLTVEDQLKALNCIYKHLNPGGVFIFDVFVPDFKILTGGAEVPFRFEDTDETGIQFARIASISSDLINQVSNICIKIEWKEMGEIKSGEWNVKTRYFFRYELENLIGRSPLKLVDIYGDSEGQPLTNDSKNFIVVCKREF
jgi:SAM-dependent methyltransferase